jgi:hypothetical protein
MNPLGASDTGGVVVTVATFEYGDTPALLDARRR